MRKKIIMYLCILLAFNLLLCSCNKDKAKDGKLKLSVEDIKNRYMDEKINNIKLLQDNYVLVESQRENQTNRFILYDLKTGLEKQLPASGEYVSLEKISDENDITLLSSGKNTESVFRRFPYLIRCIRSNDGNGEFVPVFEDKYFKLNESIEAGSNKDCSLYDIIITIDGAEVVFKQISVLIADDADIPVTKTEYDKAKNQIIFHLENTKINSMGRKYPAGKTNPFISSIEIKTDKENISVIFSLKNKALQYTASSYPMSESNAGLPYIQVRFK